MQYEIQAEIIRGRSTYVHCSEIIQTEREQNYTIRLFTHSLTHGAEPFLRSCQLCRPSRTSQHFIEPEGSLPHSSEPFPILSQIDPIHTIPSYIPKIQFNIVHTHTSWSSQWSLTFWISHQYSICITLLPHLYYMPCPSHPP
jgi:hypothetical protein